MKDSLLRAGRGYQRTFLAFTAGQKAVAIVGTAALLLGAVLVYHWVSAPAYAPLFTNMSSKDASAVVSKLDAQGTAYQITNGGATVMVPQEEVYKDRIALSGAGLPSGSDGGYSLLDNQSLSTSDFQQQVNYKRAMEGELAKTLASMDGVSTAVVHLALPSKQVFADTQDPTTASVLLNVKPGATLDTNQVQAVVHLVASSIDGLDPTKVTVADQTGKLLSTSGDATGDALAASTRDQQVLAFQTQESTRIQAILDRVLGTGNGTVQVTADLNFDQAKTSSKTYKRADPKGLTSSSTVGSEKYQGPASGATANGIVGPDGQLTQTGAAGSTGSSTYAKNSSTSDEALNWTTEDRSLAPGGVNSLHVGVVLDKVAAAKINPTLLQATIASAIGYNTKRGDTMNVSVLPFDRTAETAAAAALKAQTAADQQSQLMNYAKSAVPVIILLLALLIAWLRGRKKAKQRKEATEYLVEQLRDGAAARAGLASPVALSPAATLLALEGPSEDDAIRDELASLVDDQPEDVAALLRGWLVEKTP